MSSHDSLKLLLSYVVGCLYYLKFEAIFRYMMPTHLFVNFFVFCSSEETFLIPPPKISIFVCVSPSFDYLQNKTHKSRFFGYEPHVKKLLKHQIENPRHRFCNRCTELVLFVKVHWSVFFLFLKITLEVLFVFFSKLHVILGMRHNSSISFCGAFQRHFPDPSSNLTLLYSVPKYLKHFLKKPVSRNFDRSQTCWDR